MSRNSFIGRLTLAFLILALPTVSFAERVPIEAPDLAARNQQQRRPLIKRARQFKQVDQVPQHLLNLDIHSKAGRHTLGVTPMTERAMLYVHLAQQAGSPVKYAYRTIRGKITANPRADVPVTTSKKLFVTVSPQTFELFKAVMGPNVIWPNGTENAGHLYTMIGDQGGGSNFYSNTYGEFNSKATAERAKGKIGAGLLLTDGQMNRLVSMMNAASAHNRANVFGYKMRERNGGTINAEIQCTNWQTGAQIGSKDTRLTSRQLDAERQAITQNWSNRPDGMVGRKPLASIFGLSRAQKPSIWISKLIAGPEAPVLAYFVTYPERTKLETRKWNLSALGKLMPDGNLVGGVQGN